MIVFQLLGGLGLIAGLLYFAGAEAVFHQILGAIIGGFGLVIIVLGEIDRTVERVGRKTGEKIDNVVRLLAVSELHQQSTDKNTQKLAEFFEGRHVEFEEKP